MTFFALRRSLPALLTIATASWAPPLQAQRETPRVGISVEQIGQWGCLDCATGHQFGGIADLVVTADGGFHVLDHTAPQLRSFDRTGRMLRALGRTGSGPGEYRTPIALGVEASGRTAVVDIVAARVTRLAPDGTVVGTVRLGAVASHAVARVGSGDLYIALSDFAAGVGRIVSLGESVDSLTPIVSSLDFPPTEVVRGTVYSMAVSREGTIAIGDGHQEYRIRRYSAQTGATSQPDLVRDVSRTPRTPAEIAELERRLGGRMAQMRTMVERQGGGGGRAGASGPAPAVDPLRRHFGVGALRYDDQSRLWVRTERGDSARTVFDLFDSAGRFAGELILPARVNVFHVAGEHLLTAGVGPDEVPVITLWRVRAR
ncbi:MAG TPA: hypothetical protein VMM18_13585 [Gemmatimonadaceae bacterium]|nr:hypothetical protein [Gemmatimonadaceae bacterium]